ncbi:hypothetical protein [Micromonospora haikouensis]|uniref:hypothetical protein n=1 Tax=Micromonospora haikouensis TaxID=686309 RepID=UPI0037B91142
MNLTDLCFHLRNRRRMYLLDDRFSTAVAFVQGYDSAFDGVPLSGFHDFVATRLVNHETSFHWAYVIASTRVPAILESGVRIDQIPAEFDKELTEMLVGLLEDYQGGG